MSAPGCPPVVGIIGGSGVYDIDGLTDVEWREVDSPFGKPSDALMFGELDGQRVVFLPRDESYDWPAEAIHLRLHESQLQRELTAMVDAMSREVASKCERSNMALAHHAGLLSVSRSQA